MRAVIWHGPGKVALEQRDVPAPGPGQVLVDVLANGVCSTDYPIVEGLVAGSKPGMIIGHEPVGVVVALGGGVGSEWLGRRVALDTMLACGRCRLCQQGRPELCAHSDEIGFSVDGNWSDYACLPVANLRSLPDAIGDVEGTMIEALTCQMGAVDALGVGFGESVAIVGSGLAALLFVPLLRLKGAGYIALSMRPYPERAALARELGADLVMSDGGNEQLLAAAPVQANDGFDLAIDAVGTQEAALAALGLARRGGKALLYGLRSAVINDFPLGEVIFRNLTLYGRTSAPQMWAPAMDLVARGAICLAALGAQEIGLEELPALLTGEREHGGPLKHVVRIKEC